MIGRLLRYLEGSRPWVILAFGLLLLAKAIEVVVPATLGWLVQQVVQIGVNAGVVLPLVVKGVGWTFLLVLIGYVIDSVTVLLMNLIGQRGIFRMRTEVFEHLQRLHIGFFDHQRVGQLISRTISDIERVERGLSEGLVAGLANILLVVGIFIGMYVVDWRLAIVITVIAPFLLGLADWFRRNQQRAYTATRTTLGQLNTFIQEYLMGARVLRRFGLEREERARFDERNDAFRKANLLTIRNYAIFFGGIDWLHSLMLIAIFVGLVEFGLSGEEFRAGVFFTFSLYLLALFRPIIDLSERYNTLQEAMAAATRVFEVLDVEPAVRFPGTTPLDQVESIAFEQVWFAYDDEQWVTQGIDFRLEQGSTVALVGETGAGKTTLSSLLLRFYDPQRGRIALNGNDLRDYPLHDLRHHFSVVLQDPVIFSGTVRDNIALFDPTINDEQVVKALKFVEAWPFIEKLEGGIEAKLMEQGKRLSAGQRQLLSLARAIAQQRSVLILDEATANIDPLTEQLIQVALSRILAQKTTLVIAHRLSTIRQADQILVLDHGQIVEQGRHNELLAAKGYYEKLYRLQFQSLPA